MKTLHLKLKKNVLIVDVPELTDYEVFKHGIYFNLENGDRDFIEGNFTFLCKGEELTEDRIRQSNIIETKPYGSKPFFCTLDYTLKGINKQGFNPGFCAPNGKQYTNSFLSAISAQNYHRLVNSRGETKPISFEEDDMMVQLWKEAESKTFNPEKTLIFEIL